MKKFFLLLVAALPMVFTSCGNDDEEPILPSEINLNFSEISLNYGTTNSELKCNLDDATWSSSNPFVVTVDQTGKITAQHVGTAKVTASVGGYKASAEITVTPTNNNFRTPILNFGQSQAQIEQQMRSWEADGVFSTTVTTGIAYLTNGLLPGYGYNFENGKLKVATLTVSEEQGDEGEIYVYLGQRYKEYGTDGLSTFYCNADNVSDATIIAECSIDEDTLDYAVVWTENTGTKTRATGVFSAEDFRAGRELSHSVSLAARR